MAEHWESVYKMDKKEYKEIFEEYLKQTNPYTGRKNTHKEAEELMVRHYCEVR